MPPIPTSSPSSSSTTSSTSPSLCLPPWHALWFHDVAPASPQLPYNPYVRRAKITVSALVFYNFALTLAESYKASQSKIHDLHLVVNIFFAVYSLAVARIIYTLFNTAPSFRINSQSCFSLLKLAVTRVFLFIHIGGHGLGWQALFSLVWPHDVFFICLVWYLCTPLKQSRLRQRKRRGQQESSSEDLTSLGRKKLDSTKSLGPALDGPQDTEARHGQLSSVPELLNTVDQIFDAIAFYESISKKQTLITMEILKTMQKDLMSNIDLCVRNMEHILTKFSMPQPTTHSLPYSVFNLPQMMQRMLDVVRKTLHSGVAHGHCFVGKRSNGIASFFQFAKKAEERNVNLCLEFQNMDVPVLLVEGDEGNLRRILMIILGIGITSSQHGSIKFSVNIADVSSDTYQKSSKNVSTSVQDGLQLVKFTVSITNLVATDIFDFTSETYMGRLLSQTGIDNASSITMDNVTTLQFDLPMKRRDRSFYNLKQQKLSHFCESIRGLDVIVFTNHEVSESRYMMYYIQERMTKAGAHVTAIDVKEVMQSPPETQSIVPDTSSTAHVAFIDNDMELLKAILHRNYRQISAMSHPNNIVMTVPVSAYNKTIESIQEILASLIQASTASFHEIPLLSLITYPVNKFKLFSTLDHTVTHFRKVQKNRTSQRNHINNASMNQPALSQSSLKSLNLSPVEKSPVPTLSRRYTVSEESPEVSAPSANDLLISQVYSPIAIPSPPISPRRSSTGDAEKLHQLKDTMDLGRMKLGVDMNRGLTGSAVIGDALEKSVKKRKVSPPINVLIVEDNPINQAILIAFLRKRGIKHSVASDGLEAVRKFKQDSFHLVLMDIQLPLMDGIEATRQIRAFEKETIRYSPSSPGSPITPTTPSRPSPLPVMSSPQITAASCRPRCPSIIVALTASSSREDRTNALTAGCNDFISKPINLKWLETKIVEWGSIQALIDYEWWGKSLKSGNLKKEKDGKPQVMKKAPPTEIKKIAPVEQKVDKVTKESDTKTANEQPKDASAHINGAKRVSIQHSSEHPSVIRIDQQRGEGAENNSCALQKC
ncbi:hypothetical protein BKA69DRAFT_1050183 [Paraphysoderma sedebokerense]|nr:hypothetical protein BKA69DRAFT_1050183 [Paraphysoderma sedebokerense]